MFVEGDFQGSKVSTSAAVFCSRADQQGKCLLSHRLKLQPFLSPTCNTTVLCMLCVTAYTPVLYTHPLPSRHLYTRHFHIDNSDLLVGLWNHRAAAG